MIALEDALASYAANLGALSSESIPIAAAAHRVLAESLEAANDLPRIDQSAMDGYALRVADIANACSAAALRLPIVQQIAAGAHARLLPLAAGTAARILTGAPLPPGADSVIPQEFVTREENTLVFTEPWPAGRNTRCRGEELRAGAAIAAAGQRITPGLLASLINAGITRLKVYRRPRIRLLVTGDEVRPAGSALAQGQIPDSNGPLMCAVLARWGYVVTDITHVDDDAHAMRDALQRALDSADVVISSGGASVGDRDFIVSVAEQIGVRRVFWKVAQKPAKPLYFGLQESPGRNAALLALPGNPGAVLIGMALHVQRMLEVLEGVAEPAPHWAIGIAVGPVECDPQRSRLLRMRLAHDGDGTAQLSPLPRQESHMLSNLSAADVLVWLPAADRPVDAGERLRWTRLPA